MKRFALYFYLIYNICVLCSCHDTVVPPDEGPFPKVEAERTVIVYMAADNSLSSLVRGDTTEMAQAKHLIPEDVNFIIYLDDKANKPTIYELSAKKGMQKFMESEEELCSTNAETMLSMLRQIEYFFPARHYGITFWSHASGWVPRRETFGQDHNHGATTQEKEMEISELRDVLAQLPKFDYIFFDACFMQSIEVAYELRKHANWMIGSPAEIPGPGAPYDKIMSALCQGDARDIVRGYDSGYPGIYDQFYYSGTLLSCICMPELDALVQATGRFLTPLYMDRKEVSVPTPQPYCTTPNMFTFCLDMRTTMRRLLSDEDYAAWMEFFDRAVPLRTLSYTCTWHSNYCSPAYVNYPDCYGGVTMFTPMTKYDAYGWNEEYQKTSWYAAMGWQATGW